MDWLVKVLIGSFFLILGAIIWNNTVAKNDNKSEKSHSSNIINHFVQNYQFEVVNDVASGYFDKRLVRLFENPLRATIGLQNQKNLSLLIEKAYSTPAPFLIDTPVENSKDLVIKSNYPMMAVQVIDDNIVKRLVDVEMFSFFLEADSLSIRFGNSSDTKSVENLLRTGISLVDNVEALGYAYSE